MLKVLLVVVLTLVVNSQQHDKAANHIRDFKKNIKGPVGIMSTAAGAPIERKDAEYNLNRDLLANPSLMESLSQLARERIPVRAVHAKGAGAFGYFITTRDISHICKADFLSEVGKVTPIAVRFSVSVTEKGGPDLNRETRGFAVKFYTKEGNFDIAGFNTPIFEHNEPAVVPGLVHSSRKHPANELSDTNMHWDFLTLRPESLFIFMYVYGHEGIPDGYRNMPGFSIHTYPLYNANGTITYARWRFYPVSGVKSLNSTEAARLAAEDPDYCASDLYNAIAEGENPSWEVSLQLMTQEDVNKATFKPFDLSQVIPESQFPWIPIGKIVLNRNPINYFAEVEQLAMGPGNLVPGVQAAPDKIFQARTFLYKDGHRHRLGNNHDKIPVNCPYRSNYRHTYLRDGEPPVSDNGDDTPNYYPNSYNGPVSYVDENRPAVPVIHEELADNFEQANDYYTNQLTYEQQSELVDNIVTRLSKVTKKIQDRAVKVYAKISHDLSKRIAAGLDEITVQLKS